MNKPRTTDNRPTPGSLPATGLVPAAIADPQIREIPPEEIAWVRSYSDWLDGELLSLEDRFDEYVTRSSFRPTCR